MFGACEHFVQFYEDDAVLGRSVGSFIGSALGAGSAGIVIATAEHRAVIEHELSSYGIDVSLVKGRNQYVPLDAEETLSKFIRDGWPDAEMFQAVLGPLMDKACAGGRQLHAFGEMVAILLAQGNGKAALRLEELWNDLGKRYEFSLFCGYPINGFYESSSIDLFEHICKEHSRVIPAESYGSANRTADEQVRAIAVMQQKAAALENEIAERRRAEEGLHELSRTRQILQEVASALVSEQELVKVVQLVTDAGCEVSGAAFGAFFYIVRDGQGESYKLYTLSGAPPEEFSDFPMPRNTAIFAPTFSGKAIVRLGDVTQDPRFGQNAPYYGTPPGHLPVKSYLAAPVISKSGEVFGALLFGDPRPNVFTQVSEEMVVALAAQAATAIDNANLQTSLQRELAAVKRAEVQSRHLASIVESSDDAIISKTLDGIITSWNAGAERMFGYTEEEVVGQPITILFPEGHIDEEATIIGQIRRGLRVDHYETKRRDKAGNLVDISLSVSPIKNDAGEVIGASKIARDITQRKRDEEALKRAAIELAKSRDELEEHVQERTASLREAVAQMEEFSYTVSHDLRAPLRAMNVHCRALMEDYRDLLEREPDALHSVDRIAENCTRLDKMIQDILTYGRVARDELTIEVIPLDKLVHDTIYHYPALQPPNAEVIVEPLGEVIGHEPSLVQIISNLLNNAIKFVAPGNKPVVRVRTERHGDKIRLWIEDNGIGIDPQYHHRLFTMFERIHAKLPYEGTGIGLAIVRKAAERMGGAVGLESDGHSGSRFWVDLQAAGGAR
ncbi:PAS domain S-box protein [Fimbriimonas ginsengisoli]|uniref:histidine kinase n=1 Tax=Fimbriimonas ginsengisoli Gsoil 348 TaxID=661478 RepID=A0A068NR24_FIMGI|nr:PAS domain S-box protein [Fimbriimonas ginsengisoli]AIE85891.1 putative two-component sensor histidine kinase protein [Fimbriimonas ginsengisoli Gsoil 348]